MSPVVRRANIDQNVPVGALRSGRGAVFQPMGAGPVMAPLWLMGGCGIFGESLATWILIALVSAVQALSAMNPKEAGLFGLKQVCC